MDNSDDIGTRYDGVGWETCQFCGEDFTDDLCLSKAHARIAALEAQVRERDASINELCDRSNDNAILASQAIDAKSKAEAALAAANALNKKLIRAQELDLEEKAELRKELAAAREENERLRKAWSETEKEWRPHCLPDENCPTYYDGCHCSPATAAHFAEENERLESELAALKSRSEGAVRVERVARTMHKALNQGPVFEADMEWWLDIARVVIAATDGEGE